MAATMEHQLVNGRWRWQPTSTNGIYTSYARIADVKAYDTNGGTCSAGFQFRDLNTEQWDPDGIILGLDAKSTSGNLKTNGTNYSQSTNNQEFALGAGTYAIRASTTNMRSNRTFFYLRQNDTDVGRSNATNLGTSTIEYTNSTDVITVRPQIFKRFTLTATKILTIRQHCQTASTDTYAFGINTNVSGYNSVYSLVEIYKE